MTSTCTDQHYRSPRPRICACGKPAAFWTLPPEDCQICGKPQAIHDPNGDGRPQKPWCVACRNQSVTDDGDAA